MMTSKLMTYFFAFGPRLNSLTFLLLLLWLITGCSSTRQITSNNLAKLYDPKQDFPAIDYAIFHSKEDSSTLFFQLNPSDLLYTRAELTDSFYAQYQIRYSLLESYKATQVIDSGSVLFTDFSHFKNPLYMQGQMVIPFSSQSKATLMVLTVTDIKRKFSKTTLFPVQKDTSSSFKIKATYASTNALVFHSYIKPTDTLVLTSADTSTKWLYVHYFAHKQNTIAAPPFSEVNNTPEYLKADSTFTIPCQKGESPSTVFNTEGIYFITTDSAHQQGLTLLCFHPLFPEIKQVNQLVEPLRYLTTQKEYEKIKNSDTKKKEIDDFWLACTGNPNQAKHLVSYYYNRVEQANKLFTSTVEGWKTDRGIIYIIYGMPTEIYKSDAYETWTFGNSQMAPTTTFTFQKKPNKLSNNHFLLLRSESYRDSWFLAIRTWRR